MSWSCCCLTAQNFAEFAQNPELCTQKQKSHAFFLLQISHVFCIFFHIYVTFLVVYLSFSFDSARKSTFRRSVVWLLVVSCWQVTCDMWHMTYDFVVFLSFFPFLSVSVLVGIGATISTRQEIQFLPYSGFLTASDASTDELLIQ